MKALEKYFVKHESQKTGKNTWSILNVSVFMKDGETETKIGE